MQVVQVVQAETDDHVLLLSEVYRRNMNSTHEGRDHLRLKELHELKHEGEKTQGAPGEGQRILWQENTDTTATSV